MTLNDEATARLSIPWPSLAVEANLSEILEEIVDFLDGITVAAYQVSSLPAAGNRGNLYQLTSTGLLYFDDGTVLRGPFGVLNTVAGTITDSAPGDTQAAGATGLAADAGHRHGRETAATALAGTAALTTYYETLLNLGSMGSSSALDFSQANAFKGTLNANCTVTVSNVPVTTGQRIAFSLELLQDATGGRTVTWPASFDWGTAGAPSLSAANKADFISGYTDNNGTTWKVFYGGAGGF